MPRRTQPTNDLESLRLPELQQRFLEVVGEETRCPNRTFLIRRIEQALLQRAEQPDAPEPHEEAPTPAEPEEQPEPPHELEAAAVSEAVASEEGADAPESAAIREESATPHEETPTAEEHAEPSQQSAQPRKRARKNTSEVAGAGRAERGRFKTMTVDELQTMYLQKVGRPTGSTDKAYVELGDMWSWAPARRVLPRRAREATPHNRAAFSGGMTLRFPRPEACMATGAASWRSQGERA